MGDARTDRSRRAAARRARRLATPLAAAGAALLLGGCNVLGIGGGGKYPTHSLSVFALHVGDCLNPPTKIVAQVANLQTLSCRAPHTEQVYALVHDGGSDTYPGPQKLQSFANAKCLQDFAGFVGVPYQQSSLFFTYLLPSVRSWESGDRTVTCVVTTTGAKLTSSVQGSKR